MAQQMGRLGQQTERIGQLDGLRGLAIAAVLLHHLLGIRMLWAGVDLFFMLSGFLITGILLGRKQDSLGRFLSHFYERRARRILPPYLLLLVLTTLLFGLHWMHHWPLYFFLMNTFSLLHFGTPESLSMLWSLAVEEQFYLVWPLVLFFLSETAIACFAATLLVLAPILRWACTPLFPLHSPIYMLTPFRMDLLAAGALLAVLWRTRRRLIERYGVYGPIASALAIGALLLLSRNPRFSTSANTPQTNVWIYELSLIACAGGLLWALSGRYTRMLNWAPSRYLGRISYSIYLIHNTVLILAVQSLHSRLAILSATLIITLVYSALSWHFLEKPILYASSNSPIRNDAIADERAITSTTL